MSGFPPSYTKKERSLILNSLVCALLYLLCEGLWRELLEEVVQQEVHSPPLRLRGLLWTQVRGLAVLLGLGLLLREVPEVALVGVVA